MTRHQRRPGVGPLAGWRGDGTAQGRGAPNPDQIERYIANGGFWTGARPRGGRLLQAMERRLSGLGRGHRLLRQRRSPTSSSSTRSPSPASRPPPSARATASRPRTCANSSPAPWRRCRSGTRRPPTPASTRRPFRCTPSPSARRRCTTPGARRTPGSGRSTARTRSTSPARSGTRSASSPATGPTSSRRTPASPCPVARMDAQNAATVWTWNAIGKRPGAWALDPAAPEATRGFLLNHLIPESLPPGASGHAASNSDPVTGQAAWYDLRVRLERVPARSRSPPRVPAAGVAGRTRPASPLRPLAPRQALRVRREPSPASDAFSRTTGRRRGHRLTA